VRLILEPDICGDIAYDSQIQQQLWRLSLTSPARPTCNSTEPAASNRRSTRVAAAALLNQGGSSKDHLTSYSARRCSNAASASARDLKSCTAGWSGTPSAVIVSNGTPTLT